MAQAVIIAIVGWWLPQAAIIPDLIGEAVAIFVEDYHIFDV
jgi:hypothetical protein